MKHHIAIVIILLLSIGLFACGNSITGTNGGLTNAKVETAVNYLTSDYRLGGRISVKGIQELPQQNAAVADLQFDQFEYALSNENMLVKAADFNQSRCRKTKAVIRQWTKCSGRAKSLIPTPEKALSRITPTAAGS